MNAFSKFLALLPKDAPWTAMAFILAFTLLLMALATVLHR